MYQALYRKYRPSKFDEVVGQDVIVKTLGNAIINNKVSHAYLFSGPRGTGKTSIAKIFAKMLNCENLKELTPCNKCVSCTQINNNQNIDVIEIDAASNNGVDEIREIRNKISLVPTNSKYKVYIIDEVHMLTTQAFNALLKTLEEPPSHAIFIFATTEYYKIPKTILSRCQRFDYKKVSVENIIKRLKTIIDEEKIKIEDDALFEIANISDGGMRDAISLLDQANSYTSDKICINDIHEINGTITKEEIEKFLTNIFDNNLVQILNDIEKYNNEGKDLVKILQEIIEYLKNILIYQNTKEYIKETEFLKNTSIKIGSDQIYKLIKNFSNCVSEMKKTNNIKTLFEIEVIKNINSDIKTEDNIEITKKEKVKKEDKVFEVEPKVEDKKEIKEIKLNNFELKLKDIRINNSLVSFSKKARDEFKEKLEELKVLLLDQDYSKYVSILLDGELKAISNETFMLIYKNELMANQFNVDLKMHEKILYKQYGISYKPIAVSENEWDEIKNKYNANKESYKYIEEPEENIETQEEIKEEKNSIEEIFDDIIEYS